jgi:hypothetical protein
MAAERGATNSQKQSSALCGSVTYKKGEVIR